MGKICPKCGNETLIYDNLKKSKRCFLYFCGYHQSNNKYKVLVDNNTNFNIKDK